MRAYIKLHPVAENSNNDIYFENLEDHYLEDDDYLFQNENGDELRIPRHNVQFIRITEDEVKTEPELLKG